MKTKKKKKKKKKEEEDKIRSRTSGQRANEEYTEASKHAL